MFFEGWPAQREAIRAAVTAGNASAAQRVAHALKGNLAALGAKTGVAAALALDALTMQGSLDGANNLITTLELEVEALFRSFAEFATEVQDTHSAVHASDLRVVDAPPNIKPLVEMHRDCRTGSNVFHS